MSLTGSCDCCIIYRPETNFCQHQQNKIGVTNIFVKEICFGKFIRGGSVVGGGGCE